MAEFSVATWNIFLDRRFPQSERIDDIIETLARLDNRCQLGAIALQEVQVSDTANHATYIADQLYMDGLWVPHSRQKLGEHVGLIGNDLHSADWIDLGHGKSAVKAYLGDVALVSMHLRKQPKKHFPRGPEQVEQVEKLLDWVQEDEKAVLMGDWNCLPFHRPRQMLEKAWFHSVFSDVPNRRRATVPTPEFIGALTDRDRRAVRLLGPLLNVDDIYVRGLTATAAGYGEGKSDHRLVWAKLTDSRQG